MDPRRRETLEAHEQFIHSRGQEQGGAVRLLVATHYWHPHRGGIETVAFEQARRLVRRGHQVDVVTSRLPGDPPTQVDDGIQVHRIPVLNLLEPRGVPYPIFSPMLLLTLASLVRKTDVVLAHSHLFLSSVGAVVSARVAGKRAFVLQQNTYVEYKFPFNLLENAADWTLGRAVLGLASRRLAATEATAAYVERISPGPITVFQNGVDTNRFSPVTEQRKSELRASLKIDPQAFVALTVRRLSFKNGVDTLLESARRLASQPNLLVMVVGSGPDRPAIERFLKTHDMRNVRLAGFVPDDLLPDYYRVADLFVLPSLSGEGMPISILEAFASGLPCIATRAGGQVELIEEGSNGWLVPPNNPVELARSIQTCLEQPDLAVACGAMARKTAEPLDWEAQVTRLEKMLEEA